MRRMILVCFGLLIVLAGLCSYGVIGWHIKQTSSVVVLRPQAQLLAKPQKIEIVFLGTSLTSQGDWTDLLGEQLMQCTSSELNIVRVAQAGASSKWGSRAFLRHVVDRKAADQRILVVEFSANDASLYNGMPLFISRRYHEALILQAHESGYTVILATMNPGYGLNAWERPGQRRYHALYRQLAEEKNVGLLDTVDMWNELSSQDRRTALPDGLHPTSAAMNAIAVPIFYKALKAVICI